MNRPYEEYLHAIEVVEELYESHINFAGATWESETGEVLAMDCSYFIEGLMALKAYIKKRMGMAYEVIPNDENGSRLPNKVVDGVVYRACQCPICKKRYYTDVRINFIWDEGVCNECGTKKLQERIDKDEA